MRSLPLLLLLAVTACRSTLPDPSPDHGRPFSSLSLVHGGLTNGSFLAAVVLPDGRAFAGGTGGLVVQRAGGEWRYDATLPGGGIVTAAWASSAGEILAVAGSRLFYRAAEGWQELPLPNDADLLDVWGVDGDDVWVMGVGGTLFHRSGGAPWGRIATPTVRELWKMTGSRENGFLIVGQSGTVLESSDGREWHAVPVPTSSTLFGVAMGGAGRAVAVGAQGAIIWRDADGVWRDRRLPEPVNLFDVVRTGDRFLVVGDAGTVLLVGESSIEPVEITGIRGNLRVLAGEPGEMIAAGWSGTVLEERGGSWATGTSGITLYGIHAPAAGPAMAVGEGGAVLVRENGRWKERNLPTAASLLDVVGPSAAERLIVGDSGMIFWTAGGEPVREVSPVSALLRSAWRDGSRGMIVGADGVSLVREGGTWREIPTGTNAFLRQVRGRSWNDLWAVGDAGTALHFDGSRWQPHPTPSDTILRSVHVDSSGVIWVVGDAGTVLRNDGGGFVAVPSPSNVDLRAVTRIGGHLYVAGAGSSVWRMTSTGWETMTLGIPVYLLALAGERELLAVGEAGMVVDGVR